MEKGGRKRFSPATKLSRIKASKEKYELGRPARASVKMGVDLYRRWCRLRDERGENNQEFVTHLLSIYEEEAGTSDSEPESPACAPVDLESTDMDGKPMMTSTPGKDRSGGQVCLDSPQNEPEPPSAPSPPSLLQTPSQPSEFDVDTQCSQNEPEPPGASSPLQTPLQSEFDVDDADTHDISVSFVEEGDYIYLHEKEEIDSDESEFDANIFLQRGAEKVAKLEKVGEEEEVLGVMEEEESKDGDDESGCKATTRSGLHVKVGAEEAVREEFFLISKGRLKDLAREARKACSVCGGELTTTVSKANGTAAHVAWVCPQKHMQKFCTQEVVGRSHVGDIRLASAVLLSGNNFEKIRLLARFTKLNIMSAGTYYAIQANYAIPAIERCWQETKNRSVQKHSSAPVVVCGDARNDSPGHSAQYCTYTFMEHDTNDVLHVGFVDKRQTDMRSPNMEIKAFKEGLSSMEENGLKVKEVVTDAHPSIGKYMREDKPDIKHSWDVWHGAKNLAKKLTKAATRASTRRLLFWVKHIIRHFWYCSKSCKGCVADFKAKWHGLTHHVTNKHSWVAGFGGATECAHGELEERQEWLEQGEDPHRALVQVCYDKKFISNMDHYVNYRHTSMLESLHNHILMYASKRFSFKYPGYRARNLLAVIDFMAHKDRPDQTNEDGTPKRVSVWSKHAADYVPVRVKVPKTYNYIEPLIEDIFVRRAADEAPMFRRATLLPGDPRLLQPRLAPYPAPPIADILARRAGRHEEEESEVD